jgi:antitoxin ParD1/3/4
MLAVKCYLGHGLEEERTMQSVSISLPDPLKQFVEGQIAQGRYSSVSEYLREFIRCDERRYAEAKLMAGLNNTESALTTFEWNVVRKKALARI